MRQTFDETTDPSFGAKHLPLLRAEMARQGLDGFLIPHEDEHQNEYLPDANERLAWATGFNGSAGAAVVFQDRASMFTDGRYTVQVKVQTDPALFERRDLNAVAAYLETAKPGQMIGYDPRLHSPDALVPLKAAAQKAGAELKPVEANPLDLAWGADRPAQPTAPVVPHEDVYSGESHAAKRARIGQAVADAGAEAVVLTAPMSIAWLFNVRGGDVIRSPLPLAQAILNRDGTAQLFLDPDQLVVLREPVRAAERAGLDLPAVRCNRKIGNRRVFCLAGAVAHHGGVAVEMGEFDSVECFRQRADLVDLDEDRVGRAALQAHGKTVGIGHEQVIADQLHLAAEHFGGRDPALPIVFGHAVFDGEDRIPVAEVREIFGELFRRQRFAFTGQFILAVLKELGRSSVQRERDVFAGPVAGFLDGLQDETDGFVGRTDVWRKAALIANVRIVAGVMQRLFQ
jgi:hypothetical protein